MRKYLLFAIAVGLVFSLSLGNPQLSRAEKIGFVNLKEVLSNTDTGKVAVEEMKKIFEKSQKTIQEKEISIKKQGEEIERQRQSKVITEKALQDKMSSYQMKVREYQDFVKDAKEDIQNRQQELVNKCIPDIEKIINNIGEKESYTLIIDLSTIPVAYYAKDNNLTQRVTQEFNKLKKSR